MNNATIPADWIKTGHIKFRNEISQDLADLAQQHADCLEYEDISPPSPRSFCYESGMPVLVCGCGRCDGHEAQYERALAACIKLDDLTPAQLWGLDNNESLGMAGRVSTNGYRWVAVRLIEGMPLLDE